MIASNAPRALIRNRHLVPTFLKRCTRISNYSNETIYNRSSLPLLATCRNRTEYQTTRTKSTLFQDYHYYDERSSTHLQFPNPSHPLDTPSRFIINLLDDFHAGIETGKEHVTTARCNATLENLKRCHMKGSAERAETILERMENISFTISPSANDSNYIPQPNVTSYNCVMESYYRQRNYDKVKQLFERMIVPPNPRTFLLNHFAKSTPGAFQWEETYLRQINDDVIDKKKLDELIQKYSREKSHNGAERAEDVLNLIGEMVNLGYHDTVGPDVKTFNLVVSAWAKSGSPQAVERATAVVSLMRELHDAKHGGMTARIRPDKFTYSSLIAAYTGSSDAPDDALDRIDEIVRLMEIEAEREGDERLRPDVVTYTAVINAHAYHRRVDAGPRSMELLEEMIEKGLTPDITCYNAVLSAWAHSKVGMGSDMAMNAARICWELLERIDAEESVTADYLTLRYTLRAIGRTHERDEAAVDRAEELIRRMEEGYASERFKEGADVIDYNWLLMLYSRGHIDNAHEKCEAILSKLENELRIPSIHARSEGKTLRPNTASYAHTMQAWARSKQPDKARRAHGTLQRLINFHETTKSRDLQPDANCYRLLYLACARSFECPDQKRDALQIALRSHKDVIKSGIALDARYFRNIFNVCNSLLDKGSKQRNQFAVSLFLKCCDLGVVDDTILRRLKKSVGKELLVKLLGRNDCREVRYLPPSWSRNVTIGRNRL